MCVNVMFPNLFFSDHKDFCVFFLLSSPQMHKPTATNPSSPGLPVHLYQTWRSDSQKNADFHP